VCTAVVNGRVREGRPWYVGRRLLGRSSTKTLESVKSAIFHHLDSSARKPTRHDTLASIACKLYHSLGGIAIAYVVNTSEEQHQGQPYRILFAFDPKRDALLLLGGNKAGDKRWYRKAIPRAEAIFARHLEELEDQSA